MSAQVARFPFPYKLLMPSAKRTQKAEKNAFCKLSVTETMHRFTHFPAADFREI